MKKKYSVRIAVLTTFLLFAPLLSAHAGEDVTFSHKQYKAGQHLVQKLCLNCHNEASVSQNRVKPWGTIIAQATHNDFHVKVTQGITPVMPGFPELSKEQTAAMYAYLRHGDKATSKKSAVSPKAKAAPPGDKAQVTVAESELEKNLSSQLRCPCCGKAVKDCSCGMIPKIRSQIRGMEKRGLGEDKIKDVLAEKYGNKILPIAEIDETLDPDQFYQVAKAYDIARDNPEILEKITCFCPCYRSGHTTLLDCYKDKHASRCKICLEEALQAQELCEQGVEDDEVVQTIHEKFRPKITPVQKHRAVK